MPVPTIALLYSANLPIGHSLRIASLSPNAGRAGSISKHSVNLHSPNASRTDGSR